MEIFFGSPFLVCERIYSWALKAINSPAEHPALCISTVTYSIEHPRHALTKHPSIGVCFSGEAFVRIHLIAIYTIPNLLNLELNFFSPRLRVRSVRWTAGCGAHRLVQFVRLCNDPRER